MKVEILRYGNYISTINLSRGGNCIELQHTGYGVSVLRKPDDIGKLDNPYLYGMPVLFPVNRISGGAFTFEGRTYMFPINEPSTGCHLHGELHQYEFRLIERTDAKLVCAYQADKGHPYLAFPHAFELRMEYELSDSGLTHKVRITNYSDTNMPCFLGFHSTFNVNFAQGGKTGNTRVWVSLSEEYERNMSNYLPTGRKLAYDAITQSLLEGDFDPLERSISRHYRAAQGGRMVLYDTERDLSVVYENDEKYQFRLIYNGNADGYICLEPQTCLANCTNAPVNREEAGFDYVRPGEWKEYTSRIYLAEGDRRKAGGIHS